GNDGARYFGPYHSATSCRETIRIISRHFQLRTCTDHVLANRQRPCIQYQIKRCPAPCVLPVDPAAYAERVEDVALFLASKKDELLPRLRQRMQEHAAVLEYERAAELRDQIAAIERTLAAQVVVSTEQIDQDVVGYHQQENAVELVVLFMRQGKLVGRRSFPLADQQDIPIPIDEVVRSFVRQYYELGSPIPDQVLLPLQIEDQQTIADWLGEQKGRRVAVVSPRRGAKAKLVALAVRNAEASYRSRLIQEQDSQATLERLRERLGLRRLPRRIECFDVAHLQGTATVASMVVFVDGAPARAEYRRFRVKSASNDDFAAMYEVLSRRFRRATLASEKGEDTGAAPGTWSLPDLIIVDGGKGQLASAGAALGDAGLADSPEAPDMVALAKAAHQAVPSSNDALDNNGSACDRVFLAGLKEPLRLRPGSAELRLLARARDEAHRFANTYHRRLREQSTLRSALENVPGIGPARRRQLLRHLGSLEQIRQTSCEELAKIPGMTEAAALAIKQFLG
ncbi:MAG: excinuclease ABC subunit UvrC, partial [Pseudomonadota bacterium]